MSNDKRTIYVGALPDEATDKLLLDAFIPFGDIVDIQMPVGLIEFYTINKY